MAANAPPGEAPCLTRDDYSIGWISALAIESAAAAEMLDSEHDSLPVASGDSNDYVLGSIGKHNVVMACMNEAGGLPASIVATNLMKSFRNIRYILMVGIGGGIPSGKYQIRLGDVVVSEPTGNTGGVVQSDFGKWEEDGFKIKGSLNRPADGLIRVVGAMKRDQLRNKSKMHTFIKHFPSSLYDTEAWKYQGRENDPVYRADPEPRKSGVCPECQSQSDTHAPDPKVHYGIIASGNQVIRSREQRDKLRDQLEACCVEMEAFGLMNNFPCLVVRGISDYADGQKNDTWQPYASLAAAAYAKELLLKLSSVQLDDTPNMTEQLKKLGSKIEVIGEQLEETKQHQEEQRKIEFLDWLSDFKTSKHDDTRSRRVPGTGQWVLDHQYFQQWCSDEEQSRILCCFGDPGVGKTFISSLIIDTLRETQKSSQQKMGLAYVYCDFTDQKLPPERRKQTAVKMLAAIIRQLLAPMAVVPEKIIEIYQSLQKAGDSLSLRNATEMLGFTCAVFSRIYICVDAVDELDEGHARSLLKSFQAAPSSICLFVTGRNHMMSTFEEFFEADGMLQIQVKAMETDVKRLVNYNISTRPKKEAYMMNDTLKDEITEKVIIRSAGNFLLAANQIDFVLGGRTIANRRSHLDELPPTTAEAFSLTLERIKGQSKDKRDQGIQILAWVYLSEQALSVHELRHALATEKHSTDLNHENFVPGDILPESCLGLVVVDTRASTIQLVHKSLQDYLDDCDDDEFHRKGQSMIAETCITYLRFQSVIKVSTSMAQDPNNHIGQSHDLALVKYAARQWGNHLRESGQEEHLIKLAEEYLSMDPLERYLGQQYLLKYISKGKSRSKIDGSLILSFSKFHIAAHFGILPVLPEMGTVVDELDLGDNNGRTPLSYAAENGQNETVKLLAEKNVTLDLKDSWGWTPLWYAAANRHGPTVKLLVEKGSDINVKDYRGATRLHYTAQEDDTTGMLLLLKSSANAEIKDENDSTPLGWAIEYESVNCIKTLLDNAVELDYRYRPIKITYGDNNKYEFLQFSGSEDISRLLQQGSSMSEISRLVPDTTPLLRATKLHNETAVRLLLEKGSDPNFTDSRGYTPLLMTAMKGQATLVELLLNADTEADFVDREYGRTPLSWTAENGHEAVVKLLLQKGANIESTDPRFDVTPLVWAVKSGHVAVVQLLLEKGANIEFTGSEFDRTPLAMAVEAEQVAVATLLLERGANLEFRTSRYGWTPLSIAAIAGHTVLVKLLLSQDTIDVDSQDIFARTPLSLASEKGHVEVVKLLLSSTGNPDSKDIYGQTPLAKAVENGHVAVVELLLTTDGVDPDSSDACGEVPLSKAAFTGHEIVLELLLAKEGAKPDFRDCYGRTLLWWAAAGGHEEVVKLLLTKYDLDPAVTDNFGRTPSFAATRRGCSNILKLLLEKCENNGTVIPDEDLTVAGPPAASRIGCDVCCTQISDTNPHYHCEICGNANFDICQECVTSGAKCLDPSHNLVKRIVKGDELMVVPDND